MTCKSCEERRKKLKAMYDSSLTALQNAITALTGEDNGTEATGTPTSTDGKSVEAAATTKPSTSTASK